jgi:amino acid efflux transporter
LAEQADCSYSLGRPSISVRVRAAAAAGIAALIISLGTTNAFIASISRLGYALSHDQWPPRPLTHVSSRQVPSTSIILVGSMGAAGLALAWLEHWGTQSIVAIPLHPGHRHLHRRDEFGLKLLPGRERVAAAIALVLTTGTLPFALTHIPIPIGVAALAIAYQHTARRRDRTPCRQPTATTTREPPAPT